MHEAITNYPGVFLAVALRFCQFRTYCATNTICSPFRVIPSGLFLQVNPMIFLLKLGKNNQGSARFVDLKFADN